MGRRSFEVFTRAALAAALVVAALTSGSVVSAETPNRKPCTMGDVMSNFESPFTQEGLATPCQYRLFDNFSEFSPYTFCEDDMILGGNVWRYDYKASGVSRAEAIAEIEATIDRVWLNGEEQVLMHSAYKDSIHPRDGQVVYQHRAFITQLPPGEYDSVWVSTYPGDPDLTVTVHLTVLPRTDAACH